MGIAENLHLIDEEIKKHAALFGHSRKDICLVAVSKLVKDDLVINAMEAGQIDFGENQVQEILRKQDLFTGKRVHMIGRLQSNKVKYLDGSQLIHSVDRLSLVRELEKQGSKKQTIFHALVQVNVAGEMQKGGISPDELTGLLEAVESCQYLKIRGLMNIGPLTDDEEEIRNNFRQMRKLFENTRGIVYNNSKMEILSMGMSDDYKIALEEGSNMVRIGSAIFGKRNYQ